jgi:hypothetical protein
MQHDERGKGGWSGRKPLVWFGRPRGPDRPLPTALRRDATRLCTSCPTSPTFCSAESSLLAAIACSSIRLSVPPLSRPPTRTNVRCIQTPLLPSLPVACTQALMAPSPQTLKTRLLCSALLCFVAALCWTNSALFFPAPSQPGVAVVVAAAPLDIPEGFAEDWHMIEFPPSLRQYVVKLTLQDPIAILEIAPSAIVAHTANGTRANPRLNAVTNERIRPVLQLLETARKGRVSLPMGLFLMDYGDGNEYDGNQLWPVLTLSASKPSTSRGNVIMIPDHGALTTGYRREISQALKGSAMFAWEAKLAKVFWRGASTGTPNTGFSRHRFLDFAKNLSFVDAGFNSIVQAPDAKTETLWKNQYVLKPTVSIVDALRYRYMLILDGNTATWTRMAWVLSSNSLLIKHESDFEQWYYPRLMPGVHYLLLRKDFSNLKELFDWAESHPKEVQDIISAARKLSRGVFVEKQIQADAIRGFEEYKRRVEWVST